MVPEITQIAIKNRQGKYFWCERNVKVLLEKAWPIELVNLRKVIFLLV